MKSHVHVQQARRRAGENGTCSTRLPATRPHVDGDMPGWLGSNWSDAFRIAAANFAHEILTIVPATQLDESVKGALLSGVQVLDSGDSMRVLFAEDILHHAPSMRVAKETAESGMEVRMVAEFPTWLTIIGREIVLAPRDPDEPQVGTLVIRAPGHVTMALWLFERLWRSARPLSAQHDSRPHLTDLEHQLLPQLTSGAKDEAAARELGVSVRTYRRHVTRLCDALGASSRFEAGVLAAQVGLV